MVVFTLNTVSVLSSLYANFYHLYHLSRLCIQIRCLHSKSMGLQPQEGQNSTITFYEHAKIKRLLGV